jgi:hypothetical protein
MCYNRYPPHVDSNILYSTLLLALLFGCVYLRHSIIFNQSQNRTPLVLHLDNS